MNIIIKPEPEIIFHISFDISNLVISLEVELFIVRET